MADTNLQQLVINVGTKAQIEAGIAGGTITQDMLSVATDGDTYIQGVKVNGTELTPDQDSKVNIDLSNYATQTWVGQQGYITGITSAMVTTALGYSPVNPTSLASVATSGSYNDLSDKPTIPAAQVNSDWNANSGVSQILNKPTLATVATSGAYSDLSGKPTIPTVNNPTITITQGGVTKGSFTLNQSTGDTIALDAGGGGSVNTFDLFDHKWSDYLLSDQSWLRADTFSWQDGTVYSDAYNHLVADYNGGTSTTETVGSYTITYKLASDGHKITTDETNVANIYNESGVAWYYILDTANTRFKLPIENPAREELIQVIRAKGNGIAFGLTDGTTNKALVGFNNAPYTSFNASTAGYGTTTGSTATADGLVANKTYGVTTDPTKSGIISSMTDSTSVYKGKKYLYFYVGQFSQSATEQTAGLNTELFNGKADRDLQNVTSNLDFVVESYNNGTEWYKIYKSGWCEQGGSFKITATGDHKETINFLKTFANTNYQFFATGKTSSSDLNPGFIAICMVGPNCTTAKVEVKWYTSSYTTTTNDNINWRACGYIS